MRAENSTPPPEPPLEIVHETAGAHLVTDIPKATAEDEVGALVKNLRGSRFDCADTIFITDFEGRLEGIVRLNDLLAAPDDARLKAIMEEEHEAVGPNDDQEAVALLATRLGMIAVPVVDDAGRLIGAVPPEALLDVLHREHIEDLQRLAGIQRHDPRADSGLNASIANRLWRRMPWLIVGLIASSAATAVVAAFEETLKADVAVSFFIPALVYIAGAIGAQAVSVSVRALSLGQFAVGRLIWEEFVIGLLIGLLLGLLTMAPVYIAFGDHLLAISVAAAVFGAGTVSAIVGFALPYGFQQLGFDPALGSGPVCTIIQDVSSLGIYFAVVTLLLF